jgi:hypothetical protein
VETRVTTLAAVARDADAVEGRVATATSIATEVATVAAGTTVEPVTTVTEQCTTLATGACIHPRTAERIETEARAEQQAGIRVIRCAVGNKLDALALPHLLLDTRHHRRNVRVFLSVRLRPRAVVCVGLQPDAQHTGTLRLSTRKRAH